MAALVAVDNQRGRHRQRPLDRTQHKRLCQALIQLSAEDNGTTRAPKQLERWLREQAAKEGWGVRFQVHWLLPNASWLDQIEMWFSILQRKLLHPNHFVSVAALEQAISDFISYYNQTAKPIKWTYTIEKLARKFGTHL